MLQNILFQFSVNLKYCYAARPASEFPHGLDPFLRRLGYCARRKKEAPDLADRGRGRMLGGGNSINSTSSPRKTQEVVMRPLTARR